MKVKRFFLGTKKYSIQSIISMTKNMEFASGCPRKDPENRYAPFINLMSKKKTSKKPKNMAIKKRTRIKTLILSLKAVIPRLFRYI
ncbi:hypothetical protein PP182_03820 [Maribacter sp. PR1]|uniref:hypothetical protein n=1 Tax=Maribacter TaxID=252356 RepID=UPI002349F337|nr:MULTISPECIES: hypothetical protein [Maribacter]MDC6387793.1 hypothetical protein [Maribacter sp. PR1]